MTDYTTDPSRQAGSSAACATWPTTSTGTRAVPVPAYGATPDLYASPDDDGRAQVDHFARLLGTGIPATRPPTPATTGPPAASARSATRSSPSPTPSPLTTPVPACYHGRHPRHLDLTLKRQSQKGTPSCRSPSWITSNPSSATRTSTPPRTAWPAASTSSAAARAASATIACYNAYPSTSGYWRCADCIGDDRIRHRRRLHRPPGRDHGLPGLREHRHHQRNPHHHQRTRRSVRAGMRRLRPGLAAMTASPARRVADGPPSSKRRRYHVNHDFQNRGLDDHASRAVMDAGPRCAICPGRL